MGVGAILAAKDTSNVVSEEGTSATMSLSESDTRAKLIDPALHERQWTEDLIEQKGKEVDEAIRKLRETLI